MRKKTIGIGVTACLLTAGVAAAIAVGGASADEHTVPSFGLTQEDAVHLLAEIHHDVPAEQAMALSDSVVTTQEYLAAAATSAECFEAGVNQAATEAGIAVETTPRPPTLSPDGFRVEYSVGIAFPGGLQEDAASALARMPRDIDAACQQRYLSDVAAAYQIAFLSDAASVSRVETSFRTCLDKSGVEIGEGDVRSALIDRGEAVLKEHDGAVFDCLALHPAITDDPRFG